MSLIRRSSSIVKVEGLKGGLIKSLTKLQQVSVQKLKHIKIKEQMSMREKECDVIGQKG